VRFAAVASAVEAMVWESETDGNPSVDADESSRRRLDRTVLFYAHLRGGFLTSPTKSSNAPPMSIAQATY